MSVTSLSVVSNETLSYAEEITGPRNLVSVFFPVGKQFRLIFTTNQFQ